MKTITLNGRRLEVFGPWVGDSGRVHAMTANQQRQWAESLGARLPTIAEVDALWDQADVRVAPKPRNVTTAPLDALHDDIEAAGAAEGELVAAGKTWVHDTDGHTVNYGWLVPASEVRSATWRGIRVYPTTVAAYAIQPPGHKHSANHVDYSQLGYCMREFAADEDSAGNVVKVISEPPERPAFTKRGDKGEAVMRMQRWLMAQGYPLPRFGADGDHGLETETALEAWRDDQVPSTAPAPVSYLSMVTDFIEARHFTSANRNLSALQCIVLHSVEQPIRSGVARNVARWFGGPSAPEASAHFIVGPNTVYQCVELQDRAWAAPGMNELGIQIEMVGQAEKTNWFAEGTGPRDGLRVVQRTARLVAALCEECGIPVEAVDVEGLKAGKRGITSHASVTAAFKRSTHVDPGMPGDRRWDWTRFLALVRGA